MFFKSNEKTYDLQTIKEEIIKRLCKEDKKLDRDKLIGLITEVTTWHINKMKLIRDDLYIDGKILDLALENKQLLLDMFDNNALFQRLFIQKSYEKKQFINDDQFRRTILLVSLYDMINKCNKKHGAEYGLVYAKAYNFDLSIPFHYVSYDNGIVDADLKKYIDTYLNIGGSIDTYFLPKYFNSDNKKDKYDIEFLSTVLAYYKNQDDMNNINPSVYAKKLKKNQ